ncbi:MAG: polysaccharide deacetylase family protein [Aquabacterium sp.]
MNKPLHSLLSLNGLSDTSSPRRDFLRQAGAAACAPWLAAMAQAAPAGTQPTTGVILCYSQFSDKAGEAGAVSKATLAEHFKTLRELKASVISMVDLVGHHKGRLANLPPRPVVLSFDGCHRSVVDILMKAMHGSDWPVSLYISPEQVGKTKTCLSWDDLSGLHHSGRFSVQSRCLSGVDLLKERRNRSDEDFATYAGNEMIKGKETVENRLVKPVSFQAWPFGSADKRLMDLAEAIGFHASVSLGDRPVTLADAMQGMPRFVMSDAIKGKHLSQIIQSAYPA